MRKIEQLSVPPERWVIDGLTELLAAAESMIETLAARADKYTVH